MIPIIYSWDGETMVPLPRFHKRCDEVFVVGETYTLVPHEERSGVSHRHYFACVKSAWDNLPELEAERFPTPDHLRKFALIKAGYRDERTFVAASKAEAVRLAAFMRPMDQYAVVIVSNAVVTVYTAKSQSMKAMGKKEFQRSKEAVLDVLANMIEVERSELEAA